MTSRSSILTARAAEGPTFKGLRLRMPPLATWIAVARERSQLARMDTHMLRDMGIDPADAAREAARPFWDLPEGR